MEDKDPLSAVVIGAAIEVHRHLGPGLLEVLYNRAIRHELFLRNVAFAHEQPVPVAYKGCHLGDDLKMDLIVEGKLIVELKAVDKLHPIHEAQLMTYLKLTGLRTGLLINFNVPMLRDGVRRLVF